MTFHIVSVADSVVPDEHSGALLGILDFLSHLFCTPLSTLLKPRRTDLDAGKTPYTQRCLTARLHSTRIFFLLLLLIEWAFFKAMQCPLGNALPSSPPFLPTTLDRAVS